MIGNPVRFATRPQVGLFEAAVCFDQREIVGIDTNADRLIHRELAKRAAHQLQHDALVGRDFTVNHMSRDDRGQGRDVFLDRSLPPFFVRTKHVEGVFRGTQRVLQTRLLAFFAFATSFFKAERVGIGQFFVAQTLRFDHRIDALLGSPQGIERRPATAEIVGTPRRGGARYSGVAEAGSVTQ